MKAPIYLLVLTVLFIPVSSEASCRVEYMECPAKIEVVSSVPSMISVPDYPGFHGSAEYFSEYEMKLSGDGFPFFYDFAGRKVYVERIATRKACQGCGVLFLRADFFR